MKTTTINLPQMLHTAAWAWLSYLLILACIDLSIYPLRTLPQWLPYYLVNAAIAVLFLGCSYWSWLQRKLHRYYVFLMVLLIAALPIVVNRFWVQRFPPGPLSNIEGLTLRLLPVLFIGLVITAWNYSLPVVALFAVGTAVLEVLMVFLNPPAEANATHAIFFISLVSSACFLVVGYFINRLVGQLKSQQSRLEEANARLVHYASTVEQLSISRERNRLARELHDTLAHTLSGLSVQLETTRAYWDVNPDTARSLLAKSLAATRSGLDETRRALKALRASPLEDLGLLLGLEKLAQSAAERGSLALALSLPEQLPSLSPDVEQCFYRIAQESVENVLHHASARHLRVELKISEGEIQLDIADDGLGFDPAQDYGAGHYGLAGMRERAQLVGARLAVNSQPGVGTQLHLTYQGV